MIVSQFQYDMPWTVAPDTRIEDARDQMKSNHLRHLPVIEGDRVVGMLSDHDVLAEYARARAWVRAPHARGATPPPMRDTVAEIMTPSPHTTRGETPIGEAISSMLRHRISALPVVDTQGLSGIITTTNFLWWYRDYATRNPQHAAATLVRDRMTSDVFTAPADAPPAAIAQHMSDKQVSHVPVVDGERLLGIISERDLVRETGRMPTDWSATSEVADVSAPGGITAADIMTPHPRIIAPYDTVGAAAGMMAEHKVGALPVVENGLLRGIISVTDVMRLVRELAG